MEAIPERLITILLYTKLRSGQIPLVKGISMKKLLIVKLVQSIAPKFLFKKLIEIHHSAGWFRQAQNYAITRNSILIKSLGLLYVNN